MANEAIELYTEGDQLSYKAAVAITGKTFVDLSAGADATTGTFVAGKPAAGGLVVGVAAYDCASGGLFTVLSDKGSIVPVTAGGTVAVGDEVEVTATGTVIKKATGIAVARAYSAATSGNDVFVRLY